MELTDKEKMQLDHFTLMQAKFRDSKDNEVVFAIETQGWYDPARSNVADINDRIFRLYLLTKIALESTIPTHALREWCYRYTGSIPEPVDLSKLLPNGA